MAQTAICRGLASKGSRALFLKKSCKCPAVNIENWVPVATLVPTHGAKYPYAKPWDYKSKPFNPFYEIFDSSKARMNPNSKMIIVEGNVAVGKNDFARRLAEQFDLLYVPSLSEDVCFKVYQNGFDKRQLNDILSENLKFYDLQKFYSDTNPGCGKIGRLQMDWFKERFYNYCQAVVHLLSTGQGLVVSSSVFGDYAYVHAMRKMGYVSPQFVDYYDELHRNSICEIQRPHITIYLDAPVSIIRQRIKERKDPKEVNSKVLSDEYLHAIEDGFKKRVLPEMRETGEVIEIDWSERADDLEMDVIVEEMANLKLESEDNEDPKFRDWEMSEDYMGHFRRVFARPEGMPAATRLQQLFVADPPFKCPEILISGDDYEEYRQKILKM